MFVPAFYSFFYGGSMGTYLNLHFSVRARALSSMIMRKYTSPHLQRLQILTYGDCPACLVIVMVIAYGKLLDTAHWTQKKRAWIAFAFWAIPQAACFIWIGIEYSKFGGGATDALDYELYVFTILNYNNTNHSFPDIPRDGSKLTCPTSSCSRPATGANFPSTGFSGLSLLMLALLPALAVCSEPLKLPDKLSPTLSIPRLDQMRESRFMSTLDSWCLLFQAWCF